MTDRWPNELKPTLSSPMRTLGSIGLIQVLRTSPTSSFATQPTASKELAVSTKTAVVSAAATGGSAAADQTVAQVKTQVAVTASQQADLTKAKNATLAVVDYQNQRPAVGVTTYMPPPMQDNSLDSKLRTLTSTTLKPAQPGQIAPEHLIVGALLVGLAYLALK